jgi:hypothetical protein
MSTDESGPDSSSVDFASPATVLERLAILEERTHPKPKSVVDRLKDWGGVASLVIAIAYSFPIGLWDRFIEPEKKKAEQEVADLRSTIEQSTIMMADGARALAGISDPFLYDVVGRSVNTRLYVLMAKHKAAFHRHKDAFTAPESLVIGYNFLSTNQIEAALIFLQHAQDQAGGDLATEVEAMRLRAKALFIQGPLQDRATARSIFAAAISRTEQHRSHQAISSYISLTAEWGLFELLDGDWACGQKQIALTRRAYAGFAPFMNDHGNFGRLVEEKTKALAPRPGQSMSGC